MNLLEESSKWFPDLGEVSLIDEDAEIDALIKLGTHLVGVEWTMRARMNQFAVRIERLEAKKEVPKAEIEQLKTEISELSKFIDRNSGAPSLAKRAYELQESYGHPRGSRRAWAMTWRQAKAILDSGWI